MNDESISQLSEKCQKCPRVNICDKKRMEACAYMEMPDPCMASAAVEGANYGHADVLVKHDYRDIKIRPNTTVTIDLEEQIRQMERDIYKALGGPRLEFGA